MNAGKESACNVGDLGWICGLGRPLEKGIATHSSILARRTPQSMGSQRVRHDKATFTFILLMAKSWHLVSAVLEFYHFPCYWGSQHLSPSEQGSRGTYIT